jgi:membrane protein implicated in regulation of membrane protease activity
MKIKIWSMFNWRMISHAFLLALATIGTVLLVWVGVTAYFVALGGSSLILK